MATAVLPLVPPRVARLLAEFEEWSTRYGPELQPVSASRYRRYAAEFCRSYDPLRATVADLQAYRVSIEESNGRRLAPSTVNVKMAAALAFFTFLKDRSYRADDPSTGALTMARVPKRLPKPLAKDQVKALFDLLYRKAHSDLVMQDRTLIEILYGSGLRRDELARLTLDNIVDRGTLKVIGKGDKERLTIITNPAYVSVRAWALHRLADDLVRAKRQEVYTALPTPMSDAERSEIADEAAFRELRSRTPMAPIFYTQAGTPLRDHADPGKYVYGRVAPYLKEIGEKDINPHRLRHTFATDLLDGGVDISTLMKLLGHSDIRTTMIYTEHRRTIFDKARLCHPRS